MEMEEGKWGRKKEGKSDQMQNLFEHDQTDQMSSQH